jgi:hypothetical protein
MQYNWGYKQAYNPLNVTRSIFEPEAHVRVWGGEDGIAHLSHMLNKLHLRGLLVSP